MATNMRQRSPDFIEAMHTAFEGQQAGLWTALPAILQSFDPSKRTCVVTSAIMARVTDENEVSVWRELPVFQDVPVQFPGGGGFVLTFPLQPGDEGIVVFASRCIDAWWQSGGIQVQAEMRMHDLSDGFFIPTVRSVPHVEADISPTDVQLRSVEPGGPFIALQPSGNIVIASPSSLSIEAPTINLTGHVVVNGEAYDDHTHFKDGTSGPVTGVKA